MRTRELTPETLNATIQSGGVLVVHWSADGFESSRKLAQVFERVAQRNPDVTFAKVDAIAHPELVDEFDINLLPTLMFFRETLLVYRGNLLLNAPSLHHALGDVRRLDMDKVRWKLEQLELGTQN